MAQALKDKKRPIYFTSTLTGAKEEFVPLSEGKVQMYNCGPTVYDFAHIGNLRAFLLADTTRRILEANGYQVKQVMNITDIGHLTSDADEGDDKMMVALKRDNLPISIEGLKKVTDKYTEAFEKDAAALNMKTPFQRPRATEFIDEQIALIQTLVNKGFAYEISDGVYFDVGRFPDYGKLGNIDLSGLREGARVGTNSEKHGPHDFVLWRKARGTIGWDSPWGLGYPGWHIECSAMSMNILGETLDIHTGGVDHIPVHHNNEIAQSEAATDKPFARYWLHQEFLRVDDKRMGKSLGNFFTLRDIEAKGINPLAYRYWLLTGHYRSPMNFTWDAVSGAETALKRLWQAMASFPVRGGNLSEEYFSRFMTAVNNDLDTPKGIAILWELIKDDSISLPDKRKTLIAFDEVLGLDLAHAKKYLRKITVPKEVKDLIKKRETARKAKNWTEADHMREEIEKLGFRVEDTPKGPKGVPIDR